MYSIGLDFGTNSVRALIVDARSGREVGMAVVGYAQGESGVWLVASQPELARQHPADYLSGTEAAVRQALIDARTNDSEFQVGKVVGVGVDATASTPLPVDANGTALALESRWSRNVSAMAWLWKDHTAIAEAAELTRIAKEKHPEYLDSCGGTYSSEWFWSKIWHCSLESPEVAAAAHSWIELADWIPAVLCGTEADPVRSVCSAGHKGWHNPAWGGYPDAGFLAACHPDLGRIRRNLRNARMGTMDCRAGMLSPKWAERLGLPGLIPVAVGGIDAHMGAVGSGVAPGTLVKILGTSTCDILVHPLPGRPGGSPLPVIHGISGVAPESVLPGHHGLEAGQAAVGDIFQWFVGNSAPQGMGHDEFIAEAGHLRPGESGLLALDWLNGNRNVLMDQQLSGLMLGQSLATRPAEMYRAWMEATAMGARMILERLQESGVRIDRIINCGGLAEKNPVLLQIYADVTGREMAVSRSGQTCALGAAIAGAVVGGSHVDVPSAQAAMTGVKSVTWKPRPEAVLVYERLFELYRQVHDAFGVRDSKIVLSGVMKELLRIRDGVRRK